MIWNEEIECMSSSEMRKLQSERLKELVNKVYQNVEFYRKKMDEKGVRPSDIRSIDDISKLPFTNKTDLRDNYPFGLFAAPMKEIVRIHASSGTTGKPTTVGYTKKDIENWQEVLARCLIMSGVTPEDIVQVSFGYGLFTGGLGIHYGAENVGCTVVPISAGNTRRQLQLMSDFGSTVLACTPSYALHLADAMSEFGYSLSDMKLKTGVFGAEPFSENMRLELEKKWGIKAFDIYGLSEIMGPGVANDCEFHDGLHIHEDHFFPEVVDPKTKEPLPDGQQGELVFTTLTKEGIPLLRYNTHDLTTLTRERCECGRTLVRMKKITGRSDDMLIIRGVNLFPSQIEQVLLEMGETSAHYMLYVDRENNLDILELKVELDETKMVDTIKDLMSLSRKIEHSLHSALGLSVKVTLVEPKSIPRSEGKAVRVIDNRKI
ncbi:MAG: phenylacetate--CoA ligase [Paludibacteraceae bacterium]|nr:phenylacetate--CoA ligase [Paludibacteraceae bacterium]MBP8966221.1 phenylacetate--CoA ligase [Paludibacteraceae bacterium]HOR39353.1 phenylacetate--CoA ligase [Paludibacteraceae bacterium]HPL76481.1 phenylacetate--CoA ligase [Paludibacteraceae bacterium]HQF11813.1 phenylacetate--CoA ligase [Paludibacteraceae bacterium]